MPTPPVEGVPLVLYYGPDSDAVLDAWPDDPFALRGLDAGGDVAAVLADHRVDCVVCHGGGSGDVDVSDLVSRVRDADESVPVVAFASDLDVGTAVDLDVTHHYAVDASFDPVSGLERLEPLIDRLRRQRRDRSMLDSMLEHIPLSMYFKDRQSRHVRVSDRQATLTGDYIENDEGKRHHAAADIVGKSEFDLYDPENAAESVADDRGVMASGDPVHEIEHIDGGQLDGTFVSTFKAPWYDGEEVVGTLGVTMDITERKQYEHQLERQNERLERFASVVSHDLRNPLEVAYGRLEFAEETGDPEHFAAAERALDRINDLIDDLLTLARQGETVDDPESVALDEAASAAWGHVDTPAATLSLSTDRRVLADPGRLQQLFENVFRNAVEHGGDGVTVTVGEVDSGSEREATGGFYVADDGPGIPEEDRDDVFDSGFSTSDDGTGLGLSIVRTIAEAHGWEVAVAESESGGSRFEFTQVQRPGS